MATEDNMHSKFTSGIDDSITKDDIPSSNELSAVPVEKEFLVDEPQVNTSISLSQVESSNVCGICDLEAKKAARKPRGGMHDVLTCSECKNLVHLHCSHLPPICYMV